MAGPKGIDYYIGDGTPVLAGDSFVVIKASEGGGYPPVNAPEIAWYAKEQARIRASGAVFGAFHYWHPSVDNGVQLANFLKHASLNPGDLVQLDAETTDGLAWPVVNARKNDMLARLKAALPRNRVLLYTYLDFLSHLDSQVGDGLWIADPDAPAGHPRVAHWALHQYGSGGVDYDIANFPDAAALRAWASAAAAPAAPREDQDMILHAITGSPDIWALSGSLYWHVVDPASLASYKSAGVPQATITAAEHAGILAAAAQMKAQPATLNISAADLAAAFQPILAAVPTAAQNAAATTAALGAALAPKA
jgi:hypothetical protein